MTNPTPSNQQPDSRTKTFSVRLDPRQLEELQRQGEGLVIPVRNLVAQQPVSAPGVILGAERRPWPSGKADKELAVAAEFVRVFHARHSGLPRFEGLKPGGDPPDVAGVVAGHEFGLEVGEIRDAEKTSGSAALDRFKSLVQERLEPLRPRFRGRAYAVRFLDPLQARQPLPSKPAALAELADQIAAALEAATPDGGEVALPPPLRSIAAAGFTAPERAPHPDDPLLTFDADLEPIVPWTASQVARRIASKKVGVSTGSGLSGVN